MLKPADTIIINCDIRNLLLHFISYITINQDGIYMYVSIVSRLGGLEILVVIWFLG